jgi:hypothetical protein
MMSVALGRNGRLLQKLQSLRNTDRPVFHRFRPDLRATTIASLPSRQATAPIA